MNIIKKQIAYNRSKRSSAIKYIVIHDTGNKSKGANASSHFNYFNGGERSASADFFVDSTQIMQVNDYRKYYTYQCGDGKGKYGITNSNSIGIEICVNSDGDYQKAYAKAVELTKYLMKELKIPITRVVRHYDASRKNCPASMAYNNWALWSEFKKLLSESEKLSMAQYEELKKEIAALEKTIESLKKSAEKVYHYTAEVPDWGRPTIQKLLDKGIYKGKNEGDLNLPENLLRTLVINDRAGLYD
jgi:N-acetylmuramoyl-L-alanine amidase CwlA